MSAPSLLARLSAAGFGPRFLNTSGLFQAAVSHSSIAALRSAITEAALHDELALTSSVANYVWLGLNAVPLATTADGSTCRLLLARPKTWHQHHCAVSREAFDDFLYHDHRYNLASVTLAGTQVNDRLRVIASTAFKAGQTGGTAGAPAYLELSAHTGEQLGRRQAAPAADGVAAGQTARIEDGRLVESCTAFGSGSGSAGHATAMYRYRYLPAILPAEGAWRDLSAPRIPRIVMTGRAHLQTTATDVVPRLAAYSMTHDEIHRVWFHPCPATGWFACLFWEGPTMKADSAVAAKEAYSPLLLKKLPYAAAKFKPMLPDEVRELVTDFAEEALA